MKVRIIDSIIDESKSEERTVRNSLIRLIQHMLKLKYQNDYPYKRSWILTIKQEQDQIINEFPIIGKGSLYKSYYMKKLDLDKIYDMAKEYAIIETDLPRSAFPNLCEWSKEQLIDKDYINSFIEEYK